MNETNHSRADSPPRRAATAAGAASAGETPVADRMFRQLADDADVAIGLHRLVFDERGRPVDYRFLYVNPAFERHTGLKNANLIGRLASDVVPGIHETTLIELYGRVVSTGEAVSLERHVEPLHQLFSIDAFRVGEGCFATIFRNVTERRDAENYAREQEERLRHATWATRDVLWEYDVDADRKRFLGKDDDFARQFGWTMGGERGKSSQWWFDRVHPDERQRIRDLLTCGLADNTCFDMKADYLFQLANGDYAHVQDRCHITRDKLGRAVRLIGAMRDVTERRKEQSDFLRLQTQLLQAQEIANLGSWEYDHEEDRLLWSDQTYRIFGLKRGGFEDSYEAFQKTVHPDDLAAVLSAYQSSLDDPSYTYDIEHRIIRQDDGRFRHVHERCTHERNGDGRVRRSFGIVQDISDGKAMEEALHEHQVHLERLVAERTEEMRRQERLISSLLDATTDLVFFKDLNGVYLGCNPEFAHHLSKSKEAIRGKTDFDLYPAPMARAFRANDKRMLRRNIPRRNEEWIAYPDGRKVLLDTLKAPYRNANGETIGVLGISRDITERKRTEDVIARLSTIQQTLVRLAIDFVNVPTKRQDAAIDQSLEAIGRLINADRAYLMRYDFSEGTICNTHEWCNTGIAPQIDTLQHENIADYPEWVNPHKRGKMVHVPCVADLAATSPLYRILRMQAIQSLITLPIVFAGECMGFVGFDAVREQRRWTPEEIVLLQVLAELYAHFEERRRAENAMRDVQRNLIEARDQARQAARAKTLFLANMSHEIRTPLNAILGYSQIVGREVAAPRIKRYLDGLKRSGEHLLDLINDLLELSRNEGQEVTLLTSRFDFVRLLEDVRLLVAHRPDAVSLTVKTSHTPDIPRLIESDAGKIRQILVNLAGNAIKFTERGDVTLSASLLKRDVDSGILVAVEVKDTGCGIHPDDHDKIFDLFVQSDKSVKPLFGTGLGLPLSRRYAQALGGDISLKSEVGQGSVFRFTFRARTCAPDNALVTSGVEIHMAEGQADYRLLVVDDDEPSRVATVALAESIGFLAESATSAEDALRRLADVDAPRVNLVLMDKYMPGMDGFEAVRRLRDLPEATNVKVLIATASAQSTLKSEALAAGACGCLIKPLRMETLAETVAHLDGVKFAGETAPGPAPGKDDATNVASLAEVDAEQTNHLHQALARGDIRLLRDLANAIDSDNPSAATVIREYLDSYDYDGLDKLLRDAARSGP